MAYDIFGNRKSKKQIKRENLEHNKRTGEDGEFRFEVGRMMEGKEVERTGRGSDYRVRERDIYGKVKRSRLYEVKSSSTAPVSKLQKKNIKKKKVTLVRYKENLYSSSL